MTPFFLGILTGFALIALWKHFLPWLVESLLSGWPVKRS